MSGVSSDRLQVLLIQESVVRPDAEVRAKEMLLKEIYREVVQNYGERALNGGKLSKLPPCVGIGANGGEPCEDDMRFTYNAIRVLMSRYMNRNIVGKYIETPSMVMARVALGFSDRVDSSRFYRMLVEGRYMPNSPTLFNMYADGAKGTLSACYVTPVYDDMRGIMDAAIVQAMTFKWGGGQGFSFSELRPRWDVVKGTSAYASGPMSFARIYDVVTETVKQGGKRRGANMGIMHAWHPDIYNPSFNPWHALSNTLPPQLKQLIKQTKHLIDTIEADYEVDPIYKEMIYRLAEDSWETIEDAGFIQAKEPPLQDANMTNFNISVGVNDAFMEAVIKNKEWWLVNPRYSSYRIHYSVSKATGMGVLEELAEKHPWILQNSYLNIFEKVLNKSLEKALRDAFRAGYDINTKNPLVWRVEARELWDKIVENAWAGGDPGLYLVDNHNKWNPTPWLGVVVATNPCGEQPLYPFESCNLGSIAIDKYVTNGSIDLDALAEDIQIAVDALDAVIDKNNHPDPRQDTVNKFTRKIGLGIMGLADALAKLNIPYDSEEAVAFTTIVMAALEVFSWKRSWELGAKLGHAPAFECREYDWKNFRCVEKGDPEELSEIHTPALVKASKVMRFNEKWVEVKYHSIYIPNEIYEKLVRRSRGRVERYGSIKLVRKESLERLAKVIFGIAESFAEESSKMKVIDIVSSPRHLLALAIWKPAEAWRVLKEYGKSLGAKAPRNTVTTTIAPTGTISIIAGTSSGIEPYFALVFKRSVAVGEFLEVVREFRSRILSLAEKHNISENLLRKIYEIISRNKGSLRWALKDLRKEIPPEYSGLLRDLEGLAKLFATSMDFDVWYHVAHQIAAQIYVDQAISKTINLRESAKKEEVFTAYFLAWLGGLKGVTVYRDNSKGVQVIYFGGEQKTVSREVARRRTTSMRIPPPTKRETQASSQAPTEIVMSLFQNSTCTTCEF